MPININIKTKVRFNGQDYDSVEAMPPDIRQKFEKIMAGMQKPDGSRVVIQTSKKVVFNGQEYAGVEAMPEEVRRQYHQIMNTIDKDGNGIPDVLEGGSAGPGQPQQEGSAFATSAPLLAVEPLPGSGDRSAPKTLLTIAIGLIVIVLLLAGIAAVYYLLRGFGG
jgi:hypothetical protein